jgi:hypothetical protein
MRRWLILAAGLSLIASEWFADAKDQGPAAPQSPGSKAGFLKWLNEVAGAKKLSICRHGQLHYPGETVGYFAQLGSPTDHYQRDGAWLFAHDKARWSDTALPPGSSIMNVNRCDVPPVWEEVESVTVGYRGVSANYIWDMNDVTLVGGELVTLREEHHDVDGSSEQNWLKAVETTVEHDQAEPEPKGERTTGILVALPPGSRWIKSWKTPMFVPFGAKNRKDAEDADLAVYVLDLGKGGIRIVIDITDDRAVPTPARADARQFVRSDHLEIWLADPDSSTLNKQLGIGLLADGGADVRWLLPKDSKEKIPAVRRAASHVEVDLPTAVLGIEGDDFATGRRSVPLAVAFSDADDAASGQQTVIATSPLRWNRRNSFSELHCFPGKNRRFPLFGTPLGAPSGAPP